MRPPGSYTEATMSEMYSGAVPMTTVYIQFVRVMLFNLTYLLTYSWLEAVAYSIGSRCSSRWASLVWSRGPRPALIHTDGFMARSSHANMTASKPVNATLLWSILDSMSAETTMQIVTINRMTQIMQSSQMEKTSQCDVVNVRMNVESQLSKCTQKWRA